ncbi:glycerol-3-phosphate acyltransferase [Striga asiatica]|uniref:Glycerol-3-phosphate acyltransferase n=1 Tax=Striga asiatica TaxID=4170 RepID=A0A5A7P2E5_STRAF|nr:glycerol-3-phosphate acyltransferase [Striga asiatica]
MSALIPGSVGRRSSCQCVPSTVAWSRAVVGVCLVDLRADLASCASSLAGQLVVPLARDLRLACALLCLFCVSSVDRPLVHRRNVVIARRQVTTHCSACPNGSLPGDAA